MNQAVISKTDIPQNQNKILVSIIRCHVEYSTQMSVDLNLTVVIVAPLRMHSKEDRYIVFVHGV